MLQRIMAAIGAEGCYFLSILKAAELEVGHSIDAITAYMRATETRKMGQDCFVHDPAGLMQQLTSKLWTINKAAATATPRVGGWKILRYERTATMQTVAHFVLVLRDGTLYDPLGASRTVADGRAVSSRILEPLV